MVALFLRPCVYGHSLPHSITGWLRLAPCFLAIDLLPIIISIIKVIAVNAKTLEQSWSELIHAP